MGKERCKPRYQGSLGATFDLRLYLYTFNWKKKNDKERTSSYKKRKPLRNYNQDENGGVLVDTVKRGRKNFQFFGR